MSLESDPEHSYAQTFLFRFPSLPRSEGESQHVPDAGHLTLHCALQLLHLIILLALCHVDVSDDTSNRANHVFRQVLECDTGHLLCFNDDKRSSGSELLECGSVEWCEAEDLAAGMGVIDDSSTCRSTRLNHTSRRRKFRSA